VADPLQPLEPAEIVELARGVVTQSWLVADLKNYRWRQSLSLVIDDPDDAPPNVGAVLVPVAAHLGGYWDRNIPAVTLTCRFVATESLEALEAEITRMQAALFPEAGS
jgi:hypothetical protein